MAKIIAIRHAKSDWSSYGSDFDRSLNKIGYKSCEVISQELKKRIEKAPDKFLVSPAKRAQLTHHEIFLSWYNDCNLDKFTIIENSLYSGSNKIVLESIKDHLSGSDISIIIGHNPILNELLYDISKKGQNLIPSNLVTAGCVIIEYKSTKYDLTNFNDGLILEYLYPRQFF